MYLWQISSDEYVILTSGTDDACVTGLVTFHRLPGLCDRLNIKLVQPVAYEENIAEGTTYIESSIMRDFVLRDVSIVFLYFNCNIEKAKDLAHGILHRGIFILFKEFGQSMERQEMLARIAIDTPCRDVCMAKLLRVSLLMPFDLHGVIMTLQDVGCLSENKEHYFVFHSDTHDEQKVKKDKEAMKETKVVLCDTPLLRQVFQKHRVIGGVEYKHIDDYIPPSSVPMLEFLDKTPESI